VGDHYTSVFVGYCYSHNLYCGTSNPKLYLADTLHKLVNDMQFTPSCFIIRS